MIGIFGGTFDPIHRGHLHVARELLLQLPLDNIIFVPCAHPAHRNPPIANDKQRLRMVTLAIHDEDKMVVDDCEIKRFGPSYTIDTLHYFKTQYPDEILLLIMGDDAFAHFTKWQEWEEILTLCHIVVVNRPGETVDNKSLDSHVIKDKSLLSTTPLGKIWHAHITPCDISATAVREGMLSEDVLPDEVLSYIKKQSLYI